MTEEPQTGQLRVWWIRNPPSKPRYYPVNSIDEAKAKIKALTQHDLNLGKFVTANAGGLLIFEDGDWTEWYSPDGNDIMEEIDDDDEKCLL